jgi:hypothetical protein
VGERVRARREAARLRDSLELQPKNKLLRLLARVVVLLWLPGLFLDGRVARRSDAVTLERARAIERKASEPLLSDEPGQAPRNAHSHAIPRTISYRTLMADASERTPLPNAAPAAQRAREVRNFRRPLRESKPVHLQARYRRRSASFTPNRPA